MPRLVIISDTHGLHQSVAVPDGDILIHAGDFGEYGTLAQLSDFIGWFSSFPHQHKIFVAGNHDWCFEREPKKAKALLRDIIYLQDRAIELMGVRFYGSPWQPRFFDWAFNLNRGKDLADVWAKIPTNTHVLITHGPPYGILDTTDDGQTVGCQDLLERVKAVQPRIHCFGHIHEGYGRRAVGGIEFINASVCDAAYRPVNEAVVLDL